MPGLSKNHSTKGYWSLFVTQFQGAFSDNLFKFLVIFLIAGMGLSEAQENLFVPLVGALFALPFILFSMAGGYLADRFSKRSVAIGTKITEVGIMCLALAGFALGNLPLLLAVIFLMSTQSAIFGPSKYGLLPELLPEKKLSWGNGTLGLGTFMAIIAGTVAAGGLSDTFSGKLATPGIFLVALAFAGLAASLGITRVPSANPEKRFRPNFLGELIRQVRHIRRDRVLYLAVMGSAFFWFLAALLQPNILFYGKDVLDLSDRESSYLQVALAIGIGLGSFTAGRVSGQKIEYGLVPLGAIGLTIFPQFFQSPDLNSGAPWRTLACSGFLPGLSSFRSMRSFSTDLQKGTKARSSRPLHCSASWEYFSLQGSTIFLRGSRTWLLPQSSWRAPVLPWPERFTPSACCRTRSCVSSSGSSPARFTAFE
jgi:acyl-[acyl-carrier-protein]-phospholipid O-acyltransferase/long-chain-fatty-acid--[acyl-carrier-protein] ligase